MSLSVEHSMGEDEERAYSSLLDLYPCLFVLGKSLREGFSNYVKRSWPVMQEVEMGMAELRRILVRAILRTYKHRDRRS